MKAAAAESYRSTYDNLLKRLCSGCLVHVDETSVSVQGVSCYVWVLASLEEAADIVARLQSSRNFAYIKRKIDVETSKIKPAI